MILAFLCIFNLAFADNAQLSLQLQNALSKALKQYHLAGISISYTLNGPNDIKTLVDGYSSLENSTPMTVNNYFEIGSITKAFISSIIMQQIEAGKLSLNETLAQVAKKYPGKNNKLLNIVQQYPYLGNITLRQYMTHTSGIADAINNPNFIKYFNNNPLGYLDDKALISITMSQKPYFAPGTKNYYGYTNTDYIIMGIVIEALTDKPLNEAVQLFLHQLKLDNIYYPAPHANDIPHSVLNNLAKAYIPESNQAYPLAAFANVPKIKLSDGTIVKNITPIALNYTAITGASGGMIANTSALVNWYWLLFNDKVVSEPYLSQMLLGVPTGTKDEKYGLAIVIKQTKDYGVIYFHDGKLFGYNANLLYVPKLHLILSVAVNISTDAIASPTDDIVGELLNIVAKSERAEGKS